MAVATYDPQAMTLALDGVPHGLADGTFLTIRYSEALFSAIQGADAEVARVKNPGAMGEIELGLLQTSTFNAVLSALAAVDQLSGLGIVPFLLTEGATVIAGGECWISEMPEVTYAKEAQTRTWKFTVAKFVTFLVGGNS